MTEALANWLIDKEYIMANTTLAKSSTTRAFSSLVMLSPFSTLLISLAVLTPAHASNQRYQIQKFSDHYSAMVKPIDDKNADSSNIIEIIDTKTKQTLLSQPADIDIDYELDNSKERQLAGRLSANIVNAPYGEHSLLIYDDFNFDGKKDLALRDGRNGCYGGPSYQVYLKQGKSFVHSESFTDLAQGYCGFFDVNKDTQTLHTMTKSGAAWHQFSEYKVIDNQPVAVRIIEEEYNSRGLISITEKTRVEGKMQVDTYDLLLPYVEQAADISFPYVYMLILDNDKQMVLNSQDKNGREELYYAFADDEGTVELLYEGAFTYDKAKRTLSFTNKPVVYQINSQGIKVRTSNKTVMLKAQPASARGSLDNLERFANVRIK